MDLRFASDPYCHRQVSETPMPGTACLHMELFAGSDFYCAASFGDGNDTWIAFSLAVRNAPGPNL